MALGTPAYMSPEQAAGDVSSLGPRSDVYSLGATLYCVLTGRAPFVSQDIAATLRAVQRGEFPAPRTVKAELERPLEVIALKAMALEPADRYASPRAVAEDVERWLADEPVSASRENWGARAARWGRRHRTFATSAGVFLVVAVVGLAAGAVLIDRQRVEAVRQSNRAEANLTLARTVVDEMYTQVARQLGDVPRMDTYQRDLLEKAVRFYERDLLRQGLDPAGRFAAPRRLVAAKIHRKLSRLEDARRAAHRALEYLDVLIAAEPANLSYKVEGAEALRTQGLIEGDDRQFEAAADRYRLAIDRWNDLVRVDPSRTGYRTDLAILWEDLANVFKTAHRPKDAEAAYRTALGILEPLDSGLDATDLGRMPLADTLDNLGNLYSDEQRYADAEKVRRRALEIRRATLRAHPRDLTARITHANGLNNLGSTLRSQGTVKEGELFLREAVTLLDAIVAEHPDRPDLRINLANSLAAIAILCRESGQRDEAITFMRRSVLLLEPTAQDPDEPAATRALLAGKYYTLAWVEHGMRRFADAESHIRRAVELDERLHRDHSGDHAVGDALAQHWALLGLITRDAGRLAEALPYLQRGAELHEAMLREKPDAVDVRGDLIADLTEGLGKTNRLLGRDAEALASYRRAALLLASHKNPGGYEFYNLACSLAQCDALSKKLKEGRSGPEDVDLGDRAMAALRSATGVGFRSIDTFRDDSDLDPLRGRRDFQLLLLDLVFPADPFSKG